MAADDILDQFVFKGFDVWGDVLISSIFKLVVLVRLYHLSFQLGGLVCFNIDSWLLVDYMQLVGVRCFEIRSEDRMPQRVLSCQYSLVVCKVVFCRCILGVVFYLEFDLPYSLDCRFGREVG